MVAWEFNSNSHAMIYERFVLPYLALDHIKTYPTFG